jgi:hypothetical protein
MHIRCHPKYFWTAMEKRLQHPTQDTRSSTSPPLPFQTTSNPIRKHFHTAFQEQHPIKWTSIYKGHLSHKWQQFSTVHVCLKGMMRTGSNICNITVGPLLTDMEIPQWCIPFGHKCTSQAEETRRIREEKNMPQIPTCGTQTIPASIPAALIHHDLPSWAGID